ncbi:MAG: PHP-associated domain-containing protein, partial [Sedimentisphaerales bacterium]
LLSQLGFVPEGLQIDALEVSPLNSVAKVWGSPNAKYGVWGPLRNCLQQTRDYLLGPRKAARLVSFSDAHRLEEVGKTFTTFTGISPCVSEFNKALLREDGREVVNF